MYSEFPNDSKADANRLEMWNRFSAIAGQLCQRFHHVRPTGVVDQCLRIVQTRVVDGLNSMQVLHDHAPHNYAFDAGTLLRGVYDAHLQGLYVLRKPETRARQYMDYLAVQLHDLVEILDKNDSDTAKWIREHPLRPHYMQNVTGNYARVRSQFLEKNGKKCRKYWYEGSLAQVTHDISSVPEYSFINAEYELMQRRLSGPVHSTPLAMILGVGVPTTGLMNFGWIFAFRILGGLADHYGWQLKEVERWAVRFARQNLFDDPQRLRQQ